MHQNAAFSAIHSALVRLLPDLAETVECRTKIANMVRDIMKSLDEEGLRFVSALGDAHTHAFEPKASLFLGRERTDWFGSTAVDAQLSAHSSV